jgi:hypothetical protein
MGTVNVRRDQVEEWLLPAPLITTGDALVPLSGNRTDTTVPVLGSAPVVPTGAAPTIASGLLADATVDPFGSDSALPLALASAVVEFDNTGSSLKDVALRDAIAEIAVTTPSVLEVGISGIVGVSLACTGPVIVGLTGDAEVEFAYYGDGNYAVFPYSLPALFTNNFQNIQDAAAEVEPTGVGAVDAVSGAAEMVLPVLTGEAVLTRKGSTPIFPFIFPLVFDTPVNGTLGLASPRLDMGCECAVALVGECSAVVDAPGSSLPSAVLPWFFPVILVGAA